MKKILFLVLLMGSSIAMAKPSYLFYQVSPKATIAKLHNNNYIISLQESENFLQYFSGKGKMSQGEITWRRFFTLWKKALSQQTFQDNTFTAVLSLVSESTKKQQILLVSLANPGFAKGVVTYQMSVYYPLTVEIGDFIYINVFFYDMYVDLGKN